MANILTVTKTLNTNGWTVTASLNSDATLPREIFAYLNTGTTSLGDFQGTIVPDDLQKMLIWTGQIIAPFGNKYVRHDVATIQLQATDDIDLIVNTLVNSVQVFSTSFQQVTPNTTIYTIT